MATSVARGRSPCVRHVDLSRIVRNVTSCRDCACSLFLNAGTACAPKQFFLSDALRAAASRMTPLHHDAAFSLPSFGRALIQNASDESSTFNQLSKLRDQQTRSSERSHCIAFAYVSNVFQMCAHSLEEIQLRSNSI
jgi:hypothetical protein